MGVTDAGGEVQFTSIAPACYDGRRPHLHFEVFADAQAAVSGDASLLISQFALPEAVVRGVYAADPRYAASPANLQTVSVSGEMVFGDNTPEQIAAQTMVMTGDAVAGFIATGMIGVQV